MGKLFILYRLEIDITSYLKLIRTRFIFLLHVHMRVLEIHTGTQ